MFEANGGGVLTVTTELVQRSGVQQDGNCIQICVEDDGPGIPEEDQLRIFDPFFTTKSPGKGTGLGLSVCHGIISEHDGQIWVESTVGKGTRFCVQIPVVAVGEDEDQDSDAVRSSQTGSRVGRILVVEDEEVVRAMVLRVLEQVGYRVDTSSDGQEALEKIATAEHDQVDYDLIICDVRMPRLNGIDLYRKLRADQSKALGRFLFITGDTVSAETIGFIEDNEIPYLEKPFEIEALLEAVQRELKS
jgi:two-component system NtrC family sensor kinase